jgi:hypothetical protein
MYGHDWGQSQHARFADALDPGAVLVDERPLDHFLRYLRGYAGLLAFQQPGGAAGDWKRMLDSDVTFLLAEICESDRQRVFEVNRLARRARWDPAAEAGLLEMLYTGLRTADDWHRRAGRTAQINACTLAGQFAGALERMIKKALRPLLREVEGREDWRTLAGAEAEPTRDWDQGRVWRRQEGEDTDAADPALAGGGVPVLEVLLGRWHTAAVALQQLARQFLALSLEEKADHPPHTTLLIAFLRLLETLKTDLNRFTERHLDFYYQTVLRLAPRGGLPDAVYVVMQLAPAFREWTQPAGSLLAAGKDARGTPILYATERALTLTQASLASPRNLSMEAVALPQQPRWITRVLAVPAADRQDGREAPLAQPELGWPVFSRQNQPGFAAAPELDAELGLYITSPLLDLSSGVRRVRVSFVFDATNFEQLRAHYLAMLEQSGLGAAGHAKNLRRLAEGFRLFASTAAGWRQVPLLRFGLRTPANGGKVTLGMCFTLARDFPPLACNGKLAGAPASPWPLLKLVLNPDAEVYQFSTFSRARIERCQVAVSVRELQGLSATSDLGPLALDQPFQPFGVQALCGARFEVAHPELGRNGVRRVRLQLRWFDMLAGCTSLGEYYSGYGEALKDPQFTLALVRYDGTRWLPQGCQPLFRTLPAAPGGPVLLQTTIELRAPEDGWRGQPPGTAAGIGHPQRGALRMELSAPGCGFGSAIYPGLAADQACRNTLLLMIEKAPLPPLRPPLAPQVRAISCDYRAEEDVALVGSAAGAEADDVPRLHYLYPFGSCPLGGANGSYLLEDDGSLGRLYLGLRNAAPGQSVVLYFHFRPQVDSTDYVWRRDGAGAGDDHPQLRWRYLRADRWYELGPQAVESATREFSHSGLVTLTLPPDITDDNRVMPAGLHWIEVRANDAALSTLAVGIHPHAVRALRCAPPAGGAASRLAPGSITGLLKKAPAVRAVLQPYLSVGGAAAETLRQFRARVSERLRHKQRLSQPADYEQLVLQAFPEVRQAKCISWNQSRAFRPALPEALAARPGEVAVAVLQGGPSGAGLEPLPRHMLEEIALALRPYLSESVRCLRIRNPRQERLQAFVNADFEPGAAIDVQIRRLERDISDWLAPWRAQPDAPLLMGCQALYAHRLAQFIMDLPYVTKLSKVKLLHTYHDGERYAAHRYDETGVVRLSTPWSVFVPAERHVIGAGSGNDPQPGIASLAVHGALVVGAVSHGDWPRDPAARRPDAPPPAPAADDYIVEVLP